ncbi:MAG TPA: AAA family ATPase [Actinoplanes sp.]|nr:AAA family ATPase [Actinoplanes sp.]
MSAQSGAGRRIALVGSYGSGKTTLSKAFAEQTGLPRTHGSPMLAPLGDSGRTIRDCTAPELLQMITERYVERVVAESRLPDGFVSDGSVVHDWVYGMVRLATGSYPDDGVHLRQHERTGDDDLYRGVLEQLGWLVRRHAAQAYDLFAFLPIEFPLADDNRPISEQFRIISDELLLETLSRLGVPVLVVRGALPQRVHQLAGALKSPAPV